MAVDADPGEVLNAPSSAPPPATPTGLAVVRALDAVPGTTYAAVVDESGTLVAETGRAGSGADLTALVDWARRATGDPDDLVVTTDRAFHVLRRRATAEGPAWAYLRVDRGRGTLGLARRAAATAGTAPTPARSAAPPRPATRAGLPRRPAAALPGSRRVPGSRPWPARPPAVPTAAPALPAPAGGWSADTDTLHRLLAGLHRLT